MVNQRELTEQQARDAIEAGELPREVIGSAPRVAVILTQDWCPQWAAMDSYLAEMEDREDLLVYFLLYNRVAFFRDFMRFKEQVWHNYEIPYVRYYRDGELAGDSNFVPRKAFLSRLGAA